MLISELAEKKVYDSSMALLGRVKDIDIDPVGFLARYLVVELEGGAAKRALGGRSIFRKVRAKVPTSYIHRLGDAIVLNVSMEDLRGKLEKA
ncbi:MAG: PRC-barrel domain-containing protein [Candidatus Bathyarchaeia archaeon]